MRTPELDWTHGESTLLVITCARCGNHWYLPQVHCPVCGSVNSDATPAAGGGLCVAVTRLHVTADGQDAPVRLALVELDEGPVVMGRVHDADLAPGDRAHVDFRLDGPNGVLVPSFAKEMPQKGSVS
ncbi:Zn-ribbon domain-containing OB-fold protein [Nocardioides sp.]|uniref:Zn-ribbon domain-containing OB-fold protein n=1 Tax=Nocardioides sp. TaxID=35761 RepID=UPI0035695053